VSLDVRLPGVGRAMPFTDLAFEQLRSWPALEVRQAGYGAAVRARGSGVSVARLHHPNAAELCLTWPVIQRLGDALAASGRIRFDPGSDWIRVPLEGASDVRLLLLLMSVAIKSHQQLPTASGREPNQATGGPSGLRRIPWPVGCTWARWEVAAFYGNWCAAMARLRRRVCGQSWSVTE
jgi:hypothetical protein